MTLDELFFHWKQVRADLIETIDKFSNEELTHVPYPSSRPAGDIMLHIADAEDGWFQYVVSREYDLWPEDYDLAHYPDKEAIKRLLAKVHNKTEAFLAGIDVSGLESAVHVPWAEHKTLSLGWIIWHVLEHEIHHRGELSLILGQLGREGLDV